MPIIRTLGLVVVLLGALAGSARAQAPGGRLNVFLDCRTYCFEDYLRDEIRFVVYVRDRTDADVHALITAARTSAGGREYTLSLIGAGRFAAVTHTLTFASAPTDPEDRVRAGLAKTLTIGLLNYVAVGGVPDTLGLTVRLGEQAGTAAGGPDPWRNWVSAHGAARRSRPKSRRASSSSGCR